MADAGAATKADTEAAPSAPPAEGEEAAPSYERPKDATTPDDEDDIQNNCSPFQAAPEDYPDPPTIPPVETDYYEILGADASCTQAQLKRKYFLLARRYHPDKAQGDKEEAEEMFKAVSEAYDVLSDPEMRLRYHKLGRKGVQDLQGGGGFTDPREFFATIFGGGMFGDIMGEMAFLRDYDRDEMMAAFDKRRINLCVALRQRLSPFVKGNVAGFKKVAKAEAEKLRVQSYGAAILRHIGYIYKTEAKMHSGGVKGWWAGVQNFGHQLVEYANIQVFDQEIEERIALMQTLPPEERLQLEEEIVQAQLVAMWLHARRETELVVRHVCKEILRDPNLTKELRVRYKKGLRLLGEIWRSVEIPEYDLGDLPDDPSGAGADGPKKNARSYYENKVAKESAGFGEGAIVSYTAASASHTRIKAVYKEGK